MLRRTKALLIESGTLVLPPLTELTVSDSLRQENLFPLFALLFVFFIYFEWFYRMVPLTQLQKKLYLSVLRKELQTLLSLTGGSSRYQSLQNIVILCLPYCYIFI